MSDLGNTTLDRDMAFDTDAMNDLLTQGKSVLSEAIRISGEINTSISNIATVYESIDASYRVTAIPEDALKIRLQLMKNNYQDTLDRMDTMLTRLIGQIPVNDLSFSQSINSVGEVLDSVKMRVEDLRSLFKGGDISLNYDEFKERLERVKADWDKTTAELQERVEELEWEMFGVSCTLAQYSYDPVNLSTGNFVYDHEDIKIGGEIPLFFHRYYNAKDRTKGVLGRCFLHNYEISLKNDEDKGKVTIRMQDGLKKTFKKDKSGVYVGSNSSLETLTKEEKGYRLRTIGGESYLFDEAGAMVRMEGRTGRGISFSYDEDRHLVRAETDNDTYLTYSYNQDGQLVFVEDHTGRRVQLIYDRKKLAEVKIPQGNIYTYRYGKNGRISEVINPRGYVAVTNTYDEKYRVTHQSFPDGGSMEFAYDDDKRHVTLTERNGSKTTYVHDSKYRNTDIYYEDGTKEHFEYNKKNQRILYTDRNGNTTRMSYDDKGNLTQAINALGDKVNLTYNGDNKLICLKVNGKEKLKNSYDSKGNLTSSKGADGVGNSISYDDKGRPVEIVNPDKTVTKVSYDDRGNITQIEESGIIRINYDYDELNRVTSAKDGNGNLTCYEYNQDSKISTVTNPLGYKRSYVYNPSGKVTEVTDFDGYKVSADYNELGKVSRLTDKEGNITAYEYDRMWNISSITYADGGVVGHTYDNNNRLKEIKLPEGGLISYTYDGNGNRLTVTNREGNCTTYEYDALNRVTQETDATGAKVSYSYDGEGNLASVTDPKGNDTIYIYDEMGRCIRVTDVLGNVTTYGYDSMGRIETIAYPNNGVERRTYKNGRLSHIEKTNGTTISYEYDNNGNCISIDKGAGEKLTLTYDALNRVMKAVNSDGGEINYTYDVMGNVTSVTDALGNLTLYSYTPNGNLKTVTDAMGNQSRYSYDNMNRLVKMERIGEIEEGENEEKIQTTIYEWNKEGKVLRITDPLGNVETFTYNKNAMLTEKCDKDGYHTKYDYDSRGLLTDILYADGSSVSYAYDELRKLNEIKDSTGITKIINDALGRVISVTDPENNTVGYKWGRMGEKLALTYPDGREAQYNYNTLGQLETLTTDKGVISYSYDEQGRLTEKSFPNSVTTKYSYNSIGRLESILHKGENITESYIYSYDLSGNKTAVIKERQGISEDSGEYQYGYDALNRLTEVTKNGSLIRRYGYDAFGNRTEKENFSNETAERTTYSYNANNQLINLISGEETKDYSYDMRGNLIGVTRGEELIKSFTFDATNRMTMSSGVKDGIRKRADYRYNGLGQRVGQNVYENNSINSEKEIRYTIDLTRQYHNLLNLKDDIAGKDQTYYWDMNVVSMEENEAYSYYLQDDLGSPMQLVDEDGLIMETYGFDEFGMELPTDNILAINVNRINNPTTAGLHNNKQQPFSFTGYQMDEAGEMYFAQARRYDASVGRFVSEDRVKGNALNPITTNPYQYCSNHPLKFIDPTGDVYIIIWSYGKDDAQDFEDEYYNNYGDSYDASVYGSISVEEMQATVGTVNTPKDERNVTINWNLHMWYEHCRRSPFARAAYTRYDELVEMGIPEEEIVLVRVDGKEDLVEKWNSWTNYESVQGVEFYSHGNAGEPNMYLGSTGLFFNESLPKLNWKASEECLYPYMNFYGCTTIDEFSQKIADYQGVRVSGNKLTSSFSQSKYEYVKINEMGTEHNVYMGVYGTYDDGSIWINDGVVSLGMQRIIGFVLGRDLSPMWTCYPKCENY